MEKTAVQMLKERLPSLFEYDDSGFYARLFKEMMEIEKQQIISVFHDAIENTWKYCDNQGNHSGEIYYNNKYGG